MINLYKRNIIYIKYLMKKYSSRQRIGGKNIHLINPARQSPLPKNLQNRTPKLSHEILSNFSQRVQAQFSRIQKKLQNHDNKLIQLGERINKYESIWEETKSQIFQTKQKNMLDFSKIQANLRSVKEEIEKYKFKETFDKIKFQPSSFVSFKADITSEIKIKMDNFQKMLFKKMSQTLDKNNQQIQQKLQKIVRQTEAQLGIEKLEKTIDGEQVVHEYTYNINDIFQAKKVLQQNSTNKENSITKYSHQKLEKPSRLHKKQNQESFSLQSQIKNRKYLLDQNNYLLDQNYAYLLDTQNQLIQIPKKVIQGLQYMGNIVSEEEIILKQLKVNNI